MYTVRNRLSRLIKVEARWFTQAKMRARYDELVASGEMREDLNQLAVVEWLQNWQQQVLDVGPRLNEYKENYSRNFFYVIIHVGLFFYCLNAIYSMLKSLDIDFSMQDYALFFTKIFYTF